MVGFTTLVSLALAVVSVSANGGHQTSPYPVGQRARNGLDALAQLSHRYFGVAWDVNRAMDTNYTQLVLAQVSGLGTCEKWCWCL